MICHVVCCCTLEGSIANSVDPDQTALLEQSDLGPYCLHSSFSILPAALYWFNPGRPDIRIKTNKSDYSRRHQQMTFSAVFYAGSCSDKQPCDFVIFL